MPPSPFLARQNLAEWAIIYVRYLQIFRDLEAAYDQTVHPQKRQDVRRALEACAGRALEVRHGLERLARGGPAGAAGGPGALAACLDDALADLRLPPEALEVPVPRYFVEDRARVRTWGT